MFSRPSHPVAPLHGRDHEHRLIDDFLAQVRPLGGALVLSGQPGVGTTTLLDLAQEQGRSAGLRVIAGSAAAFGAGRRLSGMTQVVEQLAADGPFRELAAVRTSMDTWTAGPPDRAVTETLVEGVSSMLRAAAAQAPLLLALDDGIDPEPAELAVWGQVLERVDGDPGLGLIGVLWPQHRALLPLTVRRLEVPALTDGPARRLLAQHHPELSPAFLDRILTEAAGNPLALEELPRQWDHQGSAAEPWFPLDLPLGERLRSTYRRRFAPLPDDARDLLLLQAVEPDAPLPSRLGAGPAVLRPALEAGLIDQGSDGEIAFTHPLIRTALVDLATEEQRNRAHRIWAEALEDDDPERSTYHRAAAAIDPDENLARALDLQAGRAWQRGHERRAIAAAEMAARLSPNPDGRSRRLVDAAYAGVVSGRIGAARKLLDDARKVDTTVTGSLTDAAAAAFLLLGGDGDAISAHRVLSTAIREHARTATAWDDDLVQAVHTLFAVTSMSMRRELWQEYYRISELLPASPSDAVNLARMIAELGSGRIPADTGLLDEILARIDTGTPVAELHWVIVSAFLVQRSDDLSPVLEAVLPTLLGGTDGFRTILEFHVAYVRLMTGRWDEALALTRAGLEWLSAPETGLSSWALIGIEAMIAARRGDFETARSQAQDVLSWAAPRRVGAGLEFGGRVRGAVAMAQEEYEEAFRHLSLITPIEAPEPKLAASVETTLDLVQAAMRTDRRHLAELHVQALQAEPSVQLSRYQAMLVNGAAAVAAGSSPQASALFEQTLQSPLIDRWPFEVARIRLSYGEHLRRLGAVSRARAQLTAARDAFERLGAEPWTRQATAELQASGAAGRPPQERRVAVDRLSPQEWQVSLLAASGLTNKQIAEKLFLSPRTVSNHLHRAFPKLGVTSRAGLREAMSLHSVSRRVSG